MRAACVLLMLVLTATAATVHAEEGTIAQGAAKFLGCTYSAPQSRDFERYWNKVTPENAGKWGNVEAERDHMDWNALDEAYRFAREHGYPFHMHVMVWGNQQPEWIEHLPPGDQRVEIEQWFAAVAARYADLDFVEVVNEPLHDPPDKDDEGGGNYIEALGGSGTSGWDWIVTSYRLARKHFPHARLLINDYSILNDDAATRKYLGIIRLLQNEKLVDGIGVQAHAFETADVPVQKLRANLDAAGRGGSSRLHHRDGHRRCR